MVVALVRNRVEFVKLLLETGFNMKEFVTDRRLEHLYNSIQNMVWYRLEFRLSNTPINVYVYLGLCYSFWKSHRKL